MAEAGRAGLTITVPRLPGRIGKPAVMGRVAAGERGGDRWRGTGVGAWARDAAGTFRSRRSEALFCTRAADASDAAMPPGDRLPPSSGRCGARPPEL